MRTGAGDIWLGKVTRATSEGKGFFEFSGVTWPGIDCADFRGGGALTAIVGEASI